MQTNYTMTIYLLISENKQKRVGLFVFHIVNIKRPIKDIYYGAQKADVILETTVSTCDFNTIDLYTINRPNY